MTLEQEGRNETYNGWTNRETWAVNLWLSNDERLYTFTQERAETAYRDAIEDHAADSDPDPDRHAHGVRKVAEAISDLVDELLDPAEQLLTEDVRHSMASDCGSLWRVDWNEIAPHWLEDVTAEVS